MQEWGASRRRRGIRQGSDLPLGPAAGKASVWRLVPEAQGAGWLLEARGVQEGGSKASYPGSSENSA